MSKLIKTWLAVAAGLWLSAMVSTVQAQDRVRMVTSPPGSIVHSVSSTIARVVSEHTSVTMLVTPMSGPQVFVPQVNNGQAEFTLLNAADAFEAFRGAQPAYRFAQKNLRLAAVGFTNELSLLTRRDSGIRTGADLRGKRVTGVFSAHQTCLDLATAQLANLGLRWEDVRVVPVTHSRHAVQALGEGRADVAMCVPLGQAIVQEVNAQSPVRFISMDPSDVAVGRKREHFPVGQLAAHKAGSNVGVLDDIHVWSYPFYLVAGAHVSDDLVYTVVKTIADRIGDLRESVGAFRRWNPDMMIKADVTLPVHPGARRYFMERGQWNAEIQALNDNLMAQVR